MLDTQKDIIFFLLLNQGETKDSFRYTFQTFRETRFMSFSDKSL